MILTEVRTRVRVKANRPDATDKELDAAILSAGRSFGPQNARPYARYVNFSVGCGVANRVKLPDDNINDVISAAAAIIEKPKQQPAKPKAAPEAAPTPPIIKATPPAAPVIPKKKKTKKKASKFRSKRGVDGD